MRYVVEQKGKMHIVVNKGTGSVHGAFKEKEPAQEKAKAMTERDRAYVRGNIAE